MSARRRGLGKQCRDHLDQAVGRRGRDCQNGKVERRELTRIGCVSYGIAQRIEVGWVSKMGEDRHRCSPASLKRVVIGSAATDFSLETDLHNYSLCELPFSKSECKRLLTPQSR